VSLVWREPPVVTWRKMKADYEVRLRAVLTKMLDDLSTEILAWMIGYAPWTNRTYAARLSLFATTMIEADVLTLAFGHGVPYGIYLETMGAGEWAIVLPAVDRFSLELMARLQKLGFRVERGISTKGRRRHASAGISSTRYTASFTPAIEHENRIGRLSG